MYFMGSLAYESCKLIAEMTHQLKEKKQIMTSYIYFYMEISKS